MTGWRHQPLLRHLRHPPASLKAAIFLAVVVAYATAGFMYFEWDDKPEIRWLDAFWWTIVTMATVGFGDFFPVTTGGRLLVGIPVILVGAGMLGYALTQFASFILRAERLGRRGLAVQKVVGHILLCNCPPPARLLAVLSELQSLPERRDVPVILVDAEIEELPEEIARQNVRFVRGHPAREETLSRAALGGAARAIVLAKDPRDPKSDDLTVATCLTIKHLCPALNVVAECIDPENKEILRRAGCGSIVCALELTPGLLAQETTDPGIIHVLREMSAARADTNSLFIVPITIPTAAAITVAELRRWTADNSATLVGIRQQGRVHLNPGARDPLKNGDDAIILSALRPQGIRL
ncbi:MAG: NAD-binding protein [Deltaproteobacteria bacterium]|nr:NAD-binding protein [Deltaproteobacteria bacterium]